MKLTSDQQNDIILQRHGLSVDEIRSRFKPGFINYFVSEGCAGVTITVQDVEFITDCAHLIENVSGRRVGFTITQMNGFCQLPHNLKPQYYVHPELYIDLISKVQYYAIVEITDPEYCKVVDSGLNIQLRLLDRDEIWCELTLGMDIMMRRLRPDQWQYLEQILVKQILVKQGLVTMLGYTYDITARAWRSHDSTPQEYSSRELQKKLIDEMTNQTRSKNFRFDPHFRIVSMMARLEYK